MRSIRNIKSYMEGRPVTAQRQLLLSQIKKSGGHISAKELYRCASSKNESISLATVYRTLRLFKELGLIEERRLGEVYCYYEIKESPEHQHLVCRWCGNVIEFDSDLVRRIVEEVQRDYDFKVTKTELCMEGYCKRCGNEAQKIAPVGKASKLSLEQIKTQKTDKRISEKARSIEGMKGSE